MRIENAELINITGGGISGTLLNSISRAITTIFDLGRSVGSSVRRIKSGNICPL